MIKTECRFFTTADYNEEESWLREQHKAGWKLVKITVPCFYSFEACPPEDVVYRLDFWNGRQTSDLMQMCRDFGWEHFESRLGWLYFRKPAIEAKTDSEAELFSDGESKIDMVSRIVKLRMVPLLLVFLCCVIPNLIEVIIGGFTEMRKLVFGIIFTILFLIYIFLLIYCGTKLKRLKAQYQTKEK